MDALPVTSEGPGSYAEVLRNRAVRRIAVSMTLSRSAGSMWTVALVLLVLLIYHSAALAGAATFASLVPGLVVSPVMGALLDRGQRNRLVMLDFIVASLTMVAIVLLGTANALPGDLLITLVAINSLTNALSFTGLRSSIPRLLPRHLWDRGNGIDAITSEVAGVGGPAAAGLMIGLVGWRACLLVIAVFWLGAAMTLVRIDLGRPVESAATGLLHDAVVGVRYLLGNPTLRGIAASIAVVNLADGALVICLPLIVLGHHGSSVIVGLLWAVASASSIVASALMARRPTDGRERLIYVVGIIGGGLGIGVVALANAGAAALIVGMLILGASFAPLNLAAWAMRQRRTDPAIFGRVLAVSMALNVSGAPIGAAIAGLSSHWSVEGTLLAGVGCVLVGAVLARLLIPARAEDAVVGGT